MSDFRTTLITCQQCNRRIMVRAADVQRGSIACSHVGCGVINPLHSGFYYDESLLDGLPGFGLLTHLGNTPTPFSLRFGHNTIGTADSCVIQLDRFTHNGRCYISRRHCTLTVTFDKWSGQLRYQLQDGVPDPITGEQQSSLNGTLLNGVSLQKTEIIDVSDGEVIALGGADRFLLKHFIINPAMLDTYKMNLTFNPDSTQ